MKRQTVDVIQKEILGEIANALGRTAEKLQAELVTMSRIEAELASLEQQLAEADPELVDDRARDEKRRASLIAKHRESRTIAEEQRLNLMIQREAIGLREHRSVYATFPIPREYRSSRD
jgi:hypothetical protein